MRKSLVCVVTRKERPATPEEVVRQEAAAWLMGRGYRREAIGLEVTLTAGSMRLRSDLVVFDPPDQDPLNAYIVVECKKADVSKVQFVEAVKQLESYLTLAPNAHFGVVYAGADRVHVLQKKREERAGVRTLWTAVPVARLPRAHESPPERFTVRGAPLVPHWDAPLERIPRPPPVVEVMQAPRKPEFPGFAKLAAELAARKPCLVVDDSVKIPAGGTMPRRFRLEKDSPVEIRVEASQRKTYDVSVWSDGRNSSVQVPHFRATHHQGNYSRSDTLRAGHWMVAIKNPDDRVSVSVKIIVTIDPEARVR